jgi:hypothetical protein
MADKKNLGFIVSKLKGRLDWGGGRGDRTRKRLRKEGKGI